MSLRSRPLAAHVRSVAFAVSLYFVLLREVRAESSVTYKYEDYREADGRISVKAQYGLWQQDIGTDSVLKVSGALDAIAGATPTGQPGATASAPVMLADIHDRRKAWTADFSRQVGRLNFDLGVSNSREGDYVSNGYSLTSVTDFNDKNSGLVLGIAGNDDDVKVFFQQPWLKKRSVDGIVGLNQVLDKNTTMSFNLTYGRSTGYLSDPYKIILKTTEIVPGVTLPLTFPENRPSEREKWIAFVSYNHAVEAYDGAIEASYLFFHDSYGSSSHTLSATWFQNLGAKFILAPALRYYEQDAADFYHVSLNGTSITPLLAPSSQAPYYSADYRLSHLRTVTYGVKLVWHPVDAVQLDLSYDRYDMKGLDGVTSASAYPRANTLTAGIRYAW